MISAKRGLTAIRRRLIEMSVKLKYTQLISSAEYEKRETCCGDVLGTCAAARAAREAPSAYNLGYSARLTPVGREK